MKIRKEDSNVAAVTSKSEVHGALQCVLVEPGALIATDGRICVKREVELEENETFAPFLMDSKMFKELVKSSGFLSDRDDGLVNFCKAKQKGTALERTQMVVTTSKVNQERYSRPYPDYTRVIPPENPPDSRTARLDPEYFTTLVKAFKGCDDIHITIRGPNDPIRFDATTPDGRKVVGVIMPKIQREPVVVIPTR